MDERENTVADLSLFIIMDAKKGSCYFLQDFLWHGTGEHFHPARSGIYTPALSTSGMRRMKIPV
jgi:hypothetical protein